MGRKPRRSQKADDQEGSQEPQNHEDTHQEEPHQSNEIEEQPQQQVDVADEPAAAAPVEEIESEENEETVATDNQDVVAQSDSAPTTDSEPVAKEPTKEEDPRESSQIVSALADSGRAHSSGKLKSAHVQIDAATPEHTYVEKIHTPRKHMGVHCETEADWIQDKHAHIDDDAASPHGMVHRVQTPLHTPIGDRPKFDCANNNPEAEESPVEPEVVAEKPKVQAVEPVANSGDSNKVNKKPVEEPSTWCSMGMVAAGVALLAIVMVMRK